MGKVNGPLCVNVDWHQKQIIDKRAAENRILTDAAHYWPTESLPFARALACTQVVLLHGKADKPFVEAKDAWGLPDCLKAAQDYRINFLDTRETMRGWPNLRNDPDKFATSKDFEYLIDRMGEFIRVGFNREIDQTNKSWKVVPSLDVPWLFQAVIIWTLADYLGIKLEDWNKYKPIMHGVKILDTENIMNTKPTGRIHRKIVSIFKDYGKLVHDIKLLEDAGKWYKCRVNPGSIEKFLDNEAITHILDRSRVENDIASFDLATGYPRRWRK